MVDQVPVGELARLSDDFHLDLTEDELSEIQAVTQASLHDFARLGSLPTNSHTPVQPSRNVDWTKPNPAENQSNAWAVRCEIQEVDKGALAKMRVGVKDNISVAGLPLENGSEVLRGFVSTQDAAVVHRLLKAGANVVGKTTCDDWCFSASGHTSASGRVRNPHDSTRLPGGSSSGSAVAVVVGDCDASIGCDQGGSVRLPASWSGASGLKPTHGLVPYSGIISIDPSLDHVGPMARSVEKLARLMDVLADRSPASWNDATDDGGGYAGGLRRSLAGLRVGVLQEGFGWPNRSEADVDRCVQDSVLRLRELGANVTKVSVPMHRYASVIWNLLACQGTLATMHYGGLVNVGSASVTDPALIAFFRDRVEERASLFPPLVKLNYLLGAYIKERWGTSPYAHAQTLRTKLRVEYRSALANVDVVALPTTPMKAPVHTPPQTLQEYVDIASRSNVNCTSSNLTGLPALSLPCGKADGVPIGLMLIGDAFADDLLLRTGHAYQQRWASEFTEPLGSCSI